MAVEEVLHDIVTELKDTAKTKTIIGEPIEIAGRTIIPVSKVFMGFGGGYGEDPKGEAGGGMGAAGGVGVNPVALIVVDEEGVSVASLTKGFGFDRIVELVPELIERIGEASKKFKEEEKAEDE